MRGTHWGALGIALAAMSGVADAQALCEPGTLQAYIAAYAAPGSGCTIGGQTFRNFGLAVAVNYNVATAQHGPLRADQIRMTPVNHVVDGRRFVGFRFTNTENGLEILGGPERPKDHLVSGDWQNHGFQTAHSIFFEVHGTQAWSRGRVAYEGLSNERFVNGAWTGGAACIGPCSRANLGFFAARIGQNGQFSGVGHDNQTGGLAWARLASVSTALGAPEDRQGWFDFTGSAPTAFQVRNVFWADATRGLLTSSYGLNFRMNGWDLTNSRWRADFVEYGFSHSGLSDDVWRPQAVVPEPATLGLIGLGIAGLGVAVRRRRSA